MYQHGMIAPVVALILWSIVILIWLYATRIPAMRKAKIDPEQAKLEGGLSALPLSVRQVADNYSHLMEQPTLFYAVCFALQFLDQAHPINIAMAWTYVGLRIVHSLVQCTANIIILRFSLFVLASIVLAGLAIHAAAAMGFIPLHLLH